MTTTTTKNAPPLLLCEALGFSPQLLLDDIINIANKAIQDGVNGMEEFLQKWADERIARDDRHDAKADTHDATMYEVEQGLVAFQTLLEHHTDIAFDFFEAWSLRNIFVIPPDLPVVLPHQEGLDMSIRPEDEAEAIEEIEELRKRLDGQRKLNRLLSRSIRTAARQAKRAEQRLNTVSTLASSSTMDTLENTPERFREMYYLLSTLPPLDLPAIAADPPAPGKRQWETSKTGYMNWALGRLLAKSEGVEGAFLHPVHGNNAVAKLEEMTYEIGKSEDIKAALFEVGEIEQKFKVAEGEESMDYEEESKVQD